MRSIRPRSSPVGEVPYEWTIGADTLRWGVNVADVLMVRDRDAIATGRGYARRLDTDTAQATTR